MSQESRREKVELAAAVLLAVATVASAWCSYQSALWGGEQTASLAQADALHFRALELTGEAQSLQLVDVGVFLNYVAKEASGERKVADYFRRGARPGFRPALESWIAERAAGREPRELPFKSPLYKVEPAAKAAEANHQAEAATNAANEANGRSDLFVLHTVMFAMALFFLGTASAVDSRTTKRVMLLLGGLVVILSVISVARLPRASSAPRRSDLKEAKHAAARSPS